MLLFAAKFAVKNEVGKLLIWFCVVCELGFKSSALANNAIKGGRKKLGLRSFLANYSQAFMRHLLRRYIFMKTQLLIAGVIALALYVISVGVSTWSNLQEDARIANIEDPLLCSNYGGVIEKVCSSGKKQCVIQFSDSGKSCLDSSECLGACLSTNHNAQIGEEVSGQCASSSNPCGLFMPIENGKVTSIAWVD
ncbi:hypothetical protein ACMZOO_00960 [Catenovulum sp. SX2]|uniref:hypothetical protein n=1 Tax=Catenovulum sp. SX2 TaxID=3398614 RepID=UPI003F83716A